MAPSATQLVWRARFERALRLAAPALDLLLAAGDRASRLADREPPHAVLPASAGAPVESGRSRRSAATRAGLPVESR